MDSAAPANGATGTPSLESTATAASSAVGGGVEPPRRRVVHGDLVREFADFKKRAPPARVLFLAGGGWNDFPWPVVESLREGFAAGRAILEVPVGGAPSLFDLVRMVQIDAATAAQNPIAWIDAGGRCSFPRMTPGAVPRLEKAAPDPVEEGCVESRVASDPGGPDSDRPSWAGLRVVDSGGKFYKVAEALFLAGMRRFAPATRVTSIRRCSYAGPSGNSRVRAFQMRVEMTRAARGTANLRYGWYGASPSEVASVARHGFGQPNHRCVSPEAEAVGVYLAPPQRPHASSLLCEPDDAGERHVVLCRVVTGNAEEVDMRVPRWHPSGDEFDTGVDDREKPRWWIVWSTHMNTHILPELVVSFTTSATGPLVRSGFRHTTSASRQQVFSKFLAEVGNSLPSSRVQAMETLYNHLKAGRTTKDAFMRNLRTIAGDKLLIAAMKKIRNCL